VGERAARRVRAAASVTQHAAVYLIGGSLTIGMAVFTVLGGKLRLP
jgi:hypothetical protein